MKETANIEQVKQFWDHRPCNIKYSPRELGSKEYFDEVEAKKFFVEPHIIPFSEFPKWQGKKVLEIGCGLGTAAVNFARHGADYTGIELSEESLKLSKLRFDRYGLKGKFYQGNAEHISDYVPIENYDLVYSWGVIHHTPQPRKVINEIKRYLGPDSIMKIMVYAKNSWKNFMIEAEFDQPEAQYGCPIAFTYTRDEISTRLLDQDFEILSITQDHIFPYQIPEYKQAIYVKQPWFQAMPDEIFKVLEKNLGWHLMIDAKLLGE